MSQPGTINVTSPDHQIGQSSPSESGWDLVSQAESTALLNGIGEHPEDLRLVYRTDLKKNPWDPKSTVQDRHDVCFRISNVGNSTLRKLKDFWNDELGKEKDNFFRPMIEWECMNLISLLRYGLDDNKEDELQARVWMVIKPGYWGKNQGLSSNVLSGAHAIQRMLSENGFKDVFVDIIECDVLPLAGPQMMLPPDGLDAAKNLVTELSTAIGRCISPEEDLRSQGTQGLWLGKFGEPDAIYALTDRHVVEPLQLPSHANQEYRYKENFKAFRICLLGDRYYQDLLRRAKKVEQGQDAVIEAQTGRADDEDLNNDKREDARHNVDKAKERKQMAQDFAKELEQWKDAERRRIGHVDFAPMYDVKPAGHEIDVAIIKYDTGKLPDDQKTPKNIIYVGDKYTWEEVHQLLNSDWRNKFKFPVNVNGQIALTTNVVTRKALMNPPEDMFDADGQNRRLVYKYGQTTKFTLGVVNEAALAERRAVALPDGAVKMAINLSILSLSRKYGDIDKVHGDFSAHGDSGAPIGDQKRELVGQIISGVAKPSSIITIFTPMEDIKADILDKEGLYILSN